MDDEDIPDEESDDEDDDTAPIMELMEDMDLMPDIDGLDFGIFG
jgi:hypothetical protein